MNLSRCLFLCVIACAVARAGDQQYQWKPGELYRFEYERSSVVRQPDETGKMTERKTSFAGVLIIEIRSVKNGVATALMRFDSPRVTLPTQFSFTSQADALTEAPDRATSFARATEAAIKLARWGVTLQPNGVVHIDSRIPEKFLEWTKELSNIARWRTRLYDMMLDLLENEAGLKIGSDEYDLFLSFVPPAKATIPIAAMRPQRSYSTTNVEGIKASFALQRSFLPIAQKGYPLPGLLAHTVVTMTPGEITMKDSNAIFDTHLGQLDTLNETFTVPVKYTEGPDTLLQEVTSTYHLKRLAPAITTVE